MANRYRVALSEPVWTFESFNDARSFAKALLDLGICNMTFARFVEPEKKAGK